MRSFRLVIVLYMIGFSNPFQLAAQVLDSMDLVSATPVVCSFKCGNTFENLRQSCSAASTIINRFPQNGPNVDPYKEFDNIIQLLKKDPKNPFPLTYSFSACETVCDAASTTFPNNVQVIFYNQAFLNGLKGTDQKVIWAIRCIIAHEIGHHILGHTAITGNIRLVERRKQEKRADFFSGFVIRQFANATVQDALEGLASLDPNSYFPKLDSQEDGAIYPTLANRRLAVIEGFNAAGEEKLKIGMFNQIDSIATVLMKKFGRSIIFRVLDKTLSSNQLNEAKLLIEDYLKNNPGMENKDVLYNKLSIIYEQYQNNAKALESQRKAVEMKPNDKIQIQRLKELLKKGNVNQKREAELLQ